MIEVKELRFSYGEPGQGVLEDVCFCIEQGHSVAILGNNGAGKSTLLKCINRIHTPKQGAVLLDGRDILRMPRRELAKNIAYVPQRSEATHTMVFDAVLLGRRPYIRWDATAEDKEIAARLLESFGLTAFAARYLDELSGGELQKVMLARAMAQQPRFLLLDEPTSSLDPYNQHETLRAVRDIVQNQQVGAAVVLHDLNLALRYCDRFLFLKDARVYSFGGAETVTPAAIRAVYGMPADIIEHNGAKVVVPA
jgi:iron complex transport system ATP-binding protein